MIEHFCEETRVCPMLSIAKPEIAIDTQPACMVVLVVRDRQSKLLDDAEMRLNDVEPRGICWSPDNLDVVRRVILHEFLVLVMR